MNYLDVLQKAERDEGLTVEEIKIYEQYVKPKKHVYGKYGTLAKAYIQEHNWIKAVVLGKNFPEYLHNIDRQAEETYEIMYAKLSKLEQYQRTGDFLEDVRRENQMKQYIEEFILKEIVYAA